VTALHREPFEAGNTVFAMGRVTTVEKVYANGNFKLAGIDGQWRQGGWKAGQTGYHTPRCEHYTEAVAAREARRRAERRLSNLIWAIDEHRDKVSDLTHEQIEALTAALQPVLEALRPTDAAAKPRTYTASRDEP
jgi:hypothetical protein